MSWPLIHSTFGSVIGNCDVEYFKNGSVSVKVRSTNGYVMTGVRVHCGSNNEYLPRNDDNDFDDDDDDRFEIFRSLWNQPQYGQDSWFRRSGDVYVVVDCDVCEASSLVVDDGSAATTTSPVDPTAAAAGAAIGAALLAVIAAVVYRRRRRAAPATATTSTPGGAAMVNVLESYADAGAEGTAVPPSQPGLQDVRAAYAIAERHATRESYFLDNGMDDDMMPNALQQVRLAYGNGVEGGDATASAPELNIS